MDNGNLVVHGDATSAIALYPLQDHITAFNITSLLSCQHSTNCNKNTIQINKQRRIRRKHLRTSLGHNDQSQYYHYCCVLSPPRSLCDERMP